VHAYGIPRRMDTTPSCHSCADRGGSPHKPSQRGGLQSHRPHAPTPSAEAFGGSSIGRGQQAGEHLVRFGADRSACCPPHARLRNAQHTPLGAKHAPTGLALLLSSHFTREHVPPAVADHAMPCDAMRRLALLAAAAASDAPRVGAPMSATGVEKVADVRKVTERVPPLPYHTRPRPERAAGRKPTVLIRLAGAE
jgi:hypothetical protein